MNMHVDRGHEDWVSLKGDSEGRAEVVIRDLVTVYSATGTGAIALSTAMAKRFRLINITVHFNSAPTTSEALTVKLNASGGAAYDTTLLYVNPSSSATTDIVYIPDAPLICEPGDEIDLAFANSDARTYGARIVVEEC